MLCAQTCELRSELPGIKCKVGELSSCGGEKRGSSTNSGEMGRSRSATSWRPFFRFVHITVLKNIAVVMSHRYYAISQPATSSFEWEAINLLSASYEYWFCTHNRFFSEPTPFRDRFRSESNQEAWDGCSIGWLNQHFHCWQLQESMQGQGRAENTCTTGKMLS